MEENKQIELRSEKVRNIIGQIPPILITHGTMFIGLALLSLFLAAAFIPYQPTIDTDITVLHAVHDYDLAHGYADSRLSVFFIIDLIYIELIKVIGEKAIKIKQDTQDAIESLSSGD